MTAPSPWKTLPHGPLVERGPGLWTIEGTLPSMPLNRICSIARRADDGLVIHSAVNVDETTLDQILALGTPRWLIVPNGFHRMDAPAWKARFPDLKIIAPKGSRKRVEQVVPVDFDYEEAAKLFTADQGVLLHTLEGTGKAEGAMEIRQDGVTSLVFNDALFNQPHLPGLKGGLLKLIGSTGGPRVTNLARFAMVKDKAALARSFRSLADLDGLQCVVPGHGQVIDQTPADVLRGVADGL
jgi:hypothetical protein